MNQCKRVFIVGHPGAGKELLGKTLAEKLNWQFIDADLGLEYYVGRSLNEIVGKEGEKKFLDCQSEILSAQMNKERVVITTDASVVDSEKNTQMLFSEFVVFLNASPSVQLERVSKSFLPLLPGLELKDFFEKLHTQRDHLYQQVANVTINTDNGELEEHAEHVLKKISEKEA
ncbi:shikimate kinase [Legionella israelensis]|uniref:shikimate kinase n=1 Tax=Legionella israelensis TaxID=454 RepID=UPI00117FB048|nr:shikimate kinase [Legionella israelensis]QDP73340.1 shikimate kinase [Legionella israelensis]